jgi:hypothetical protein
LANTAVATFRVKVYWLGIFQKPYIEQAHPVVSRLVVAVGLACSNDLKSYAGGSVATGRVSQAGQVMSEVPD